MAAIIELNEAQAEAVFAEGNVLCCSVPGSGKSAVLIEKTKHILATVREPNIILITFSRQAADELKEKLKKSVPPKQLQYVTAGTFHSIALRQLVQAGKASRVLNDTEANYYLMLALRQTGVDLEADKAGALVSACKLDRHSFESQPEVLELHDAYAELLRKEKKMDFTDMMVRAVSLMRAKNQADRLRPLPATNILVDEMQDIDRPQLEWLYCHNNDYCSMTGVGDDDQSIFSFRRGLGYHGMMEFAKMTDAKILTLNINYRSTSQILDNASRLISHNSDRIPKQLISDRGPGIEPKLILYSERDKQYEDIVSRIIAICKDNPAPRNYDPSKPNKYAYTVKKGQIAILTRTNFNLLPIERELIKAQIPCFRVGRKPIWEEPVVETLTSLLTSLHNRDNTGLEIALKWFGVADIVLDDIKKLFEGVHNFLNPKHAASKHNSEYGKQLAEFAVLAGGWIKTLTDPDDPSEAAQGVIYGVCSWMIRVIEIKNQEAGKGKKDTRSINLIESALELLDLVRGDLRQRLIRAKNDEEPNMPRVVLGTFHSSKGLEWEYVFLADCNQGLIPSKEAEFIQEQLEEERRLMYVAETRARDSLVIYADETRISQFVFESGFILPEKEKRPELVLQG